MSTLPPVGWADIATKRDLDALGDRLDAVLCRELRAFRREIATDFSGIRRDLAIQTRVLLISTACAATAVGAIVFAIARTA